MTSKINFDCSGRHPHTRTVFTEEGKAQISHFQINFLLSWLGLMSVQQWDDVVVMISCRDLGQGQILQSGRYNHRQNHVQHRSFGIFTTTTNHNMYYLILQSRGHNNNNNTSICENKLSIIVNYNLRQHCFQYQCTAPASRDLLKWTRKMRKNIKYYWDHVTRSFTKPQLPSIQIHPNNPGDAR